MLVDCVTFKKLPIRIVRDDLYPSVGGGNKSRKANFYEIDMKKRKINALVTTGGIQSNHCRAMALLAAKNSWRCHIVYHGTKERFMSENGNALVVRMCGAETEFVNPSDISRAMDDAMQRFRDNGLIPYYVTGGGHDIPGGMAYVDAVSKLIPKLNSRIPDFIFLPNGTGSTQSGIIAGLRKCGLKKTKVIGISVARSKDRAKFVTDAFSESLCKAAEIRFEDDMKADIYDDFLCGGYENSNDEILNLTREVAKETGILLDSTYSGKAFYGMIRLIESHAISGDILFWHTGGILNLQA